MEDVRVRQQPLDLGVIVLLDAVVVVEGLLGAGTLVELEALFVEGVFVLVATDVGDGDWDGCGGTDVGFWLPDYGRRRGTAIARIFVVVEGGVDVVGLGGGVVGGDEGLECGGVP